MLRRFIKGEDFRPIPFTGKKYWITIGGIVKQWVGFGEFEKLKEKKGQVLIVFNDVARLVNVENLVQITFKPIYEYDLEFYLTAKVGFVDNNSRHRHPSNLIWMFSNSLVFKDWYRVAGYSRYLINKDGMLFNRETDTYLSPWAVDGKYVNITTRADYQTVRGASPLHRMIALAFIPYGNDVCSLDVNHLNGNKHDYSLPNLEWCTRKRNNDHAQQTGLKTDNIQITTTNIRTGEVKEYISQKACADALGVCFKSLSHHIRKNPNKPLKSHVIKRVGVQLNPIHYTSPKIVHMVNNRTGEIKVLPSLRKAAEVLNVKYPALKKRYQRRSTVYGEWELKVYSPSMGETVPMIE